MAPFPSVKAALSLLALLGYLDAKADIAHDLRLLSAVIASGRGCSHAERHGRLNFFFVLEDRATALKTRDHTFLIFEGRSWTYKQAYETVLRYGAWLKDRHGVKRDEVVAMDFINKPTYLWMFFGLWSIGAKVALVNYNLTGDALVHAVKMSKGRLVIVDQEVAQKVLIGEEGEKSRERLVSEGIEEGAGFAEREVLIFDDGVERVVDTWTGRREPTEVIGNRKFSEMGVLIYTSGTTGLPKAANIPYTKFYRSADFVRVFLRLRQNDVFYTCMPLYHSSAMLIGVATCISTGCTLSLGRRFSNRTFWPEVKESKATIIQYVGETCRYLLSAPKPAEPAEDHNHNVRLAFGNGLRPEIWAQFRERFNIPIIVEFYAMTEGHSASWNYNTGPYGAGAVGRSGWLIKMLTGRKHVIIRLDLDGEHPLRDPQTGFCRKVDVGESGELIWELDASDIKSSYVGYYGNKEASAKKILRDVFKKGDVWFRTGDLQRQGNDGYVYFIDRIGDTYRWKSENVSTNEVAETMTRFPGGGIEEINVYGVEVPNHDGRAGCAAIKLKPGLGGEAYMRELGEWMKNVMPKFKVPLFVRTMAKMEVTGTNKHVKTGLRLQGVNPEKVGLVEGENGMDAWVGMEEERVWWLRNREDGGGYVPFRKRDWDGIVGGKMKL